MRFLAGLMKNKMVIFGLITVLFSCDSMKRKAAGKDKVQRRIAPTLPCPLCEDKKASGFVLWLSQDAKYAALVVFITDTNNDGKIEAKVGDHGELLADSGTIAWVNTFTQKTEFYDAFLGSDHSNRIAILKKGNEIFAVNTVSGIVQKLEGAQAEKDFRNPCLPSREAVLSVDGDRVVYPIGPNSYRSYHLESKQGYDVKTADLLWRARPRGEGEEVFEIVKDYDGDGLAFPRSQSTCACDWCPRFARSVGSYGNVGDEISKSIYDKGVKVQEKKEFRGCKNIGKNDGAFSLLECQHTLYRGDKKTGHKTRIPYKIKIPSYENPTLDGWFPVLVLGKVGLHMGRYHIDKNVLETGPQVSRHSLKTHQSGFWFGRSGEEDIIWSLRSNQIKKISGMSDVMTYEGLIANTKKGKYVIDGFSGNTQKIEGRPTWISANGCVLFRKQTHRMTKGPWDLSCVGDSKGVENGK